MPREVRISVDKDGQAKVDFNGFVGKECLAESGRIRRVLAELGIQMEETNFIPKPELSITTEAEGLEQGGQSQIHGQQQQGQAS